MSFKTLHSARLLHCSARTAKSRFVWDSQLKQFIKHGQDRASPRQLAAEARLKQQQQQQKKTSTSTTPTPASAPAVPAAAPASTSKKPVIDADAARKRFQERKYIRGQDDSTLKVEVASIFEGVGIPIRPIAPPNDTCCMSGCPRCVYDVWTADMQLYHEALEQAQRELKTKGISESRWPDELKFGNGEVPVEADNAQERASQDVDYEIRDLDITLRTFLRFERSLRRKRAAEQAKQIALQHVSQISELPRAPAPSLS